MRQINQRTRVMFVSLNNNLDHLDWLQVSGSALNKWGQRVHFLLLLLFVTKYSLLVSPV